MFASFKMKSRNPSITCLLLLSVPLLVFSISPDEITSSFSEKDYKNLRQKVESFCLENPNDPFVPNAEFLFVKSFYEENDIVGFQREKEKLSQEHPNHPALDDLAYLEYLHFLKINSIDADQLGDRFIQDFPTSPYVQKLAEKRSSEEDRRKMNTILSSNDSISEKILKLKEITASKNSEISTELGINILRLMCQDGNEANVKIYLNELLVGNPDSTANDDFLMVVLLDLDKNRNYVKGIELIHEFEPYIRDNHQISKELKYFEACRDFDREDYFSSAEKFSSLLDDEQFHRFDSVIYHYLKSLFYISSYEELEKQISLVRKISNGKGLKSFLDFYEGSLTSGYVKQIWRLTPDQISRYVNSMSKISDEERGVEEKRYLLQCGYIFEAVSKDCENLHQETLEQTSSLEDYITSMNIKMAIKLKSTDIIEEENMYLQILQGDYDCNAIVADFESPSGVRMNLVKSLFSDGENVIVDELRFDHLISYLFRLHKYDEIIAICSRLSEINLNSDYLEFYSNVNKAVALLISSNDYDKAQKLLVNAGLIVIENQSIISENEDFYSLFLSWGRINSDSCSENMKLKWLEIEDQLGRIRN